MKVKCISYVLRTTQFYMDSGVSMAMMMMIIIIIIIIVMIIIMAMMMIMTMIIVIICKSNLYLLYALYVNCTITRKI